MRLLIKIVLTGSFALIYKTILCQISLPPEIMGNWFKPETDCWVYSFQPKFVIADGIFWEYEKVVDHAKVTEIHVRSVQKQKRIFLRPFRSRAIGIGSDMTSIKKYLSCAGPKPATRKTDQTGFQLPVLKQDSFQLSGFITDYSAKKNKFKFASIVLNHLLKDDQVTYLAEIDSLGRFHLKFPLLNPQEIMLIVNNEMTVLFAVPGSDLMICLNRDFSNAGKTGNNSFFQPEILFMGTEGDLNRELYEGYYSIKKFHGIEKKIKKSTPEEYKASRLKIMNDNLGEVNGFARQRHMSKKFVQQVENHIRYEAARDLLRYRWLNDIELSDNYLSFIDGDLPLNNEMGVVTENYGEFLKEFLYLKRDEISKDVGHFSHAEIIEYANLRGVDFPREDKKLLDLLVERKKNSDRAIDSVTENKIKRILDKNHSIIRNTGRELFQNKLRQKVIEELMFMAQARGAGIGLDILLAKMAYEVVSEEKILSEEEMAIYQHHINNPILESAVIAQNLEMRGILAKNVPGDVNVLKSKGDKDRIFELLLSKYKGKVVYIDFWAPWCGPCMAELDNAEQLKKELAGKNVIFLYLGVNCSEASWTSTIKRKKIGGEHYLLSNDEYAILSNRFQITGIPRYLLVDKNGNVADQMAKSPGNRSALLADIEHLLNQ